MARKKRTVEDRILAYRIAHTGDKTLELLLDDIEAELYALRRQVRVAEGRLQERSHEPKSND